MSDSRGENPRRLLRPPMKEGIQMSFELRTFHAPDFTSAYLLSAPDAKMAPAPADAVAPSGFHAMSIYPEYFKVDGRWLLAEESRMDCVPVFENGKIARVGLSAYVTKTNRKKLVKAISDKSPVAVFRQIAEDTELVIVSSAGRMLLFATGAIAPKTTKDTAGVAVMTLLDSGIPYNPLEKEDPDITLSAEERKAGGLGIFLVKKTMDAMEYAYADGMNQLTLRKKIG